jgi:hypothetical protein
MVIGRDSRELESPTKVNGCCGQRVALSTLIVASLVFGHVSGQLLDGAMRMGKIRLDHPIVYVKSPYASMIPSSLISKSQAKLADYTAFDNTVVLFNGFGKSTVISFVDSGKTRTLKIPNDNIII